MGQFTPVPSRFIFNSSQIILKLAACLWLPMRSELSNGLQGIQSVASCFIILGIMVCLKFNPKYINTSEKKISNLYGIMFRIVSTKIMYIYIPISSKDCNITIITRKTKKDTKHPRCCLVFSIPVQKTCSCQIIIPYILRDWPKKQKETCSKPPTCK